MILKVVRDAGFGAFLQVFILKGVKRWWAVISGRWSVKRRVGLNTEGAEFTETEPEPKYEELRDSLPPMFL